MDGARRGIHLGTLSKATVRRIILKASMKPSLCLHTWACSRALWASSQQSNSKQERVVRNARQNFRLQHAAVSQAVLLVRSCRLAPTYVNLPPI